MRNPFNREELSIPTYYESSYSTGGKSDHNFLYESLLPSGQVASAPISYSYYKNGLPKVQWYSFVANTDTIYYYYE